MIKYLEKEEDFNLEITKKLVIVDFYATWCGPCKMLSTVLEAFTEENKDIEILKIDVDKFPDIARKYTIMSVPTLLLFKDGNLEKKEVGFKNKEELYELTK